MIFLQNKKIYTVSLVLLCFFILIISVIYKNQKFASLHQLQTDTDTGLVGRPLDISDSILGTIHAPIQLIVYSNLQCEYCKDFIEKAVPTLLKKYGDKVVLVYRHVSIPSILNDQYAAEVSECVSQQNNKSDFWHFIHLIFIDPEYATSIATSSINTYAIRSVQDKEVFYECMQYHKGLSKVISDQHEAMIAGITRSPSIVVRSTSRSLIIRGGSISMINDAIQYVEFYSK